MVRPMPRSNPDFQPPPGGLRREWRRMLAEPRRLERPLVVLAGWRAPLLSSRNLARLLARLVGSPREQVLPIAFTLCHRFESAIPRVGRRIHERWPSQDP